LVYRAEQGDKDVKGQRSAINKFFELAKLEPSMECDDRFLTQEYIQQLRTLGERDGILHKGGSSSWASRMKHFVRMWRDLQASAKGAIFAVVLTEGLRKAKLTPAELGRRIGVSRTAIHFWCLGSSSPSEPHRATVAKMDEILGLSGRLVASLAGVMLQKQSLRKQHEFSPEEETALKAGKGSLRHLVLFWSKERGVTITDTLKTAGCRGWLRYFFFTTDRAVSFRASDRPTFDFIDRKLNLGGKILAAFDRELPAQKPQTTLRLSYTSWPSNLKEEFSLLEEYKFDNPKGLERTVAGRWTSSKYPDGSYRCASRDAARSIFEYPTILTTR
jgi:transcriptional regulator with XRE-family HTH domain